MLVRLWRVAHGKNLFTVESQAVLIIGAPFFMRYPPPQINFEGIGMGHPCSLPIRAIDRGFLLVVVCGSLVLVERDSSHSLLSSMAPSVNSMAELPEYVARSRATVERLLPPAIDPAFRLEIPATRASRLRVFGTSTSVTPPNQIRDTH
jgi:hypothetical protein